MTTFDKREDAFEKQFAHDEELKFKAEARRNKLLGLWAAEKLGKSGADADRKSTRLNSSHPSNSYAGSCLNKKTNTRKGYWRISNSPILDKTLTNEMLELKGYVSFSKQYQRTKLCL